MHKLKKQTRADNSSDAAVNIVWMKSGDKPIHLNLNNSHSHYRTQTYKPQLLNVAHTWHVIYVNHLGQYRKDELIEAIFKVVGDKEFYPVAYKEGHARDTFLVRQCKSAMQQLFHASLTLRMPNQQLVYLTALLNAAEYKTGQIFPTKVLERIVEKQFRRLETTDKISQVLNLENIKSHSEMSDIIINFANRPALVLLCKIISQNHNILNSINGLNLSKNDIVNPSPLKEFVHSGIKMLDLRHNNIVHPSVFEELRFLTINELYVMGNPCAANVSYLDEIKSLLPTLKLLDGIRTDKIKQSSGDTIEMMYPGDVIQDARDLAMFTQYKNSEMWCQVVIEHRGQCRKNEILKALFELFPSDAGEFFPCYYKAARIEDTFFVRNSFKHLESLLDVGLSLRVGDCEDIPITLKMNVSDFKKGHVEPSVSISAALTARFSVPNKCLNLESFHTSPELKNVIVYMQNSQVLASILTSSIRRCLLNLGEVRLGNNRISSIKVLRTLNNAKSIKILDLRDNFIESLNEFENLIQIPITELTLDGNPLCKNFSVASEYVKQVKKYFPELTKLDGSPIDNQNSILPAQRNYLCSMELYGFVDKFVNNYFPIFDSPLRPLLVEMYDSNAMISASFNYDQTKVNPYIIARIKKYEQLNRNLFVDPNFPVCYRKDDIEYFFQIFPETEHDTYSFAITVTTFSEYLISLTISGVYREPGNITEVELPFHFSRTFVFKQYANELGIFKNTSEYKIINEMIHITNVTNKELKNSFHHTKPNQKGPPITVEDKENFIVMFQKMTGLKTIWCTRCFEEATWDFKKALEVFLQMDRENRIPETAFNES